MDHVDVYIQPTVEAIRDQTILEQHGIRAEVVPHYKAPSFYVGDNQISELLVMDYDVGKARQILDLPDPDEEE